MPSAKHKSFIFNWKTAIAVLSLAGVSLLLAGCSSTAAVTQAERSNSAGATPPKILWAWERAEDLRFLADVQNPNDYGVAFLSQTITIGAEDIAIAPRRQPLEVASETFLIAVTRIETDKPRRPKLSPDQRKKTVDAIVRTLKLKNVNAVQVDFDVAVSERQFYRDLLNELRPQIPAEIPFTMTALASWCTTKSWLEDLPVDEAVPMAFRMGSDTDTIRGYLQSGRDWRELMCQQSYGFSVSESFEKKLVAGRRVYLFNESAWRKEDLTAFDVFK